MIVHSEDKIIEVATYYDAINHEDPIVKRALKDLTGRNVKELREDYNNDALVPFDLFDISSCQNYIQLNLINENDEKVEIIVPFMRLVRVYDREFYIVKDCNFLTMENLLEVISDYLVQKEQIEEDIDTESLVFKPSNTEEETPKVFFIQHLTNPTYRVKYTGNIDIDFDFSDNSPEPKKVKRIAKDKGVVSYQLKGYRQLVVTPLTLFMLGDTDLKFFDGETDTEKEEERIRLIGILGRNFYKPDEVSYIQIKYKDKQGKDVNDIIQYVVAVSTYKIYILLDDTIYNYRSNGIMNIILSFFRYALPNFYKGIGTVSNKIFKPVPMENIPTISIINKHFFNKDSNGLDYEVVRHEYTGNIDISDNSDGSINQ